MDGVPRPLQLMAKESKENDLPLNSKRISGKESMARLEPLMGLLAHGHVPLDETAARAVASYANDFHKRVK